MFRKLIQNVGSRSLRSALWKLERNSRTLSTVSRSLVRLDGVSASTSQSDFYSSTRNFSETADGPDTASRALFESVCDETLQSLGDYFEELIESSEHLLTADVNFSDGVLTVQFGEPYGTYVINRQTPNAQIWLSSPTSGPKRYDFSNGVWVYRHDGVTLHELLDQEISQIVKTQVNFAQCSYGACKT